MASIYNISPHNSTSTYGVNDIVNYNSLFYYSKIDENNGNTPSVTSASWGGTVNIKVGVSNVEKPYFFWSPSYGVSASHTPKVQEIQFGDGYIQRLANGTHNNLLTLDLAFNKRSLKEATAITHFLSSKEGYKSFYFKAIAPYSVFKKFICANWALSMDYDDNYSVRAAFLETA